MAAALLQVPLLVVDDHDDSAAMLAELLTEEGAEVRLATSAAAALDLTASFTPRVLLLDIEMPFVDGIELLRVLRLRPALAGVRAIAVSAHAYSQAKARALRAGFDAYVTKPIDLAQLMACLLTLVPPNVPAGSLEARLAAVSDRFQGEADTEVRAVLEPLRAALALAGEIPTSLVRKIAQIAASLESLLDPTHRDEPHVQRLSVDIAEILVALYQIDAHRRMATSTG